jgi:hypothetical protein
MRTLDRGSWHSSLWQRHVMDIFAEGAQTKLPMAKSAVITDFKHT